MLDSGRKTPVFIKSVLPNGNVAISRIFEQHCEKVFESETLSSNDDIYVLSERELIYHNHKEAYRLDIESGTKKPLNDWVVSWYRAILQDREGNLWVATENGLIQHYGELFIDFTDSLPPFVWSVAEDRENNLWFASYGFGLHKYDGQVFKEVETYKSLFPQAEFYTGALLSRSGDLIFPVSSGLLKFDGSNFNWLDHKAAGNSPQFVYEDAEKGLLLTAVRYGFRIIDEKGAVQQYGLKDGIHQNDFIVCIGKDKEGKYWLGSEYGLSRFQLENNHFENFTRENGKLPSSGVIAIHQDFKGNMWFGARDGLLTFDYETGEISKVAASEINSRISFIIPLKGGYLLIGTLDGLYLFNLEKFYTKKVLELKLYTKSNGFTGIQPIQNGAFQDSDGYVWIPSRNGVVQLNPEKLEFRVHPLKTYFTEINGRKIGFYRGSVKLENPFETNELKIQFESVGFSRPLKAHYSYRIIEKDQEWSDWQEENFVLLTNLSSGDYQIEVKSKTIGTLPENAFAASLFFSIDLNFWEEPYFYQVAFMIMIGLASLLVINYFRQRALRRHSIANERENRYLKIQTLQTQMNPHFIFNVLGTLQNQILKSDTDQANRHLVNLSKLIRNFLNASVKSQIPKGIALDNEIPLEKEVELIRMYIDFERLQYGEVFDYELIVAESLKISNYSVPPMIIQPYVENAIKHGLLPKKEKGNLLICMTGDVDNFVCTIEDDGIGRERAKALRESALVTHQSLGLATGLVSKRVLILNEMGYNIKIVTSDRTGGGTVVSIMIKL